MKADKLTNPTAVFRNIVSVALSRLKHQLQKDYERAYPDLREIVRLVLDEEESKAWDLTSFPHLVLPDLVEAHIARLNLRPAETNHEDFSLRSDFTGVDNGEPAFALCA